MHPAQGHVLADAGDGFIQHVVDGLAVDMRGADHLDRLADVQRKLGDVTHQRLKIGILGDEIGFRIDLDRNAAAVRDRHADKPLGRNAVGLLGGFGQTLGAQPIDGGFHVAKGLGQRLLDVHHACAGRFAQVFHHRSGDDHLISPKKRDARRHDTAGQHFRDASCATSAIRPRRLLRPGRFPTRRDPRQPHPSGPTCHPVPRGTQGRNTAQSRGPRRHCRGSHG